MPGLNLQLQESRSRIDVLSTWLPRLAVAVAFLAIGSSKFAAHSMWIAIFDRLGFGQWLRYLTGVMQVGGAVLVLIPRTFVAGIAVLACTMAGAMAAWLFVLRAPFNAVIPGVILIALLAVGAQALSG